MTKIVKGFHPRAALTTVVYGVICIILLPWTKVQEKKREELEVDNNPIFGKLEKGGE